MEKKDFFISYNHKDQAWAEWIASELESDGYSVIFDQWDWGPGNNFILKMQQAAQQCERTIMVLSPDFLQSSYTQPEWAAALARDPTGEKRLLIPVRVAECELSGFFNPIVYIDFYSIIRQPPTSDEEHKEQVRQLRHHLLQGIAQHRQKPKHEPEAPLLGVVPKQNGNPSCTDPLADYKKEVIKSVKNIDLFHLKHLTGNIPFPIRHVYIPLKANRRDLTTGNARHSKPDPALRYLHDEQKEPRELSELLSRLYALPDCRCMLVLGKPGSGKTTLLKHLAYRYASETQTELAPGLQARLPFFLRLKEIATSLGDNNQDNDLNQTLLTLYNKSHRKKPLLAECVETWLNGALVLLDGLDEVTTLKHREIVAQWVKRQVDDYEDTYFVLSSRVHAFDPYYAPDDALTVEVDDFNEDQRRGLLHNLFSHAYEYRDQAIETPPWQPENLANRLVEEIESKPHLVDLAGNPLLLSIIALLQIKHANENPEEAAELPDSRAELYGQCVQLFIEEKNWDYGRGVQADAPNLSAPQYLALLEQAAWYLQCQQSEDRRETSAVDKQSLLDHLVTELKPVDRSAVEHCLDHSHQRTLLLVEQSLDQWAFQHKTFQEYLAAAAIHHFPETQLRTLITHLGLDHWRVVFELFVEILQHTPSEPPNLLERFLRDSGQTLAEDTALAARAWYWLEELYNDAAFPYPIAEQHRLQQIAWHGLSNSKDPVALAKFHYFAAKGLPAITLDSNKWLQHLQGVADEALPFIHHVLLLPNLLATPEDALLRYLKTVLNTDPPNALSGAVALGLTYYGLGEAEALHHHLFVTIPAGEFYRGSPRGDDEANEYEIDGHRYTLPAFQIGRYPVTQAEYQQFVQATGYKHPYNWEADQYPAGLAFHPVVAVSWHDAQAYIGWLNQRQGDFVYSLPSEAQWERAARGSAKVNGVDNQRRYPWGGAFDPCCANVAETGVRRTTVVGAFPAGASPEGVLDMAGNVWEWCADWYDENYYQQGSVDENTTKGDGWKVVRGGSFYGGASFARCVYRDGSRPDGGYHYVGFRVARIVRP